MGRNKNGFFAKLSSEPGSERKLYHQTDRMPPFGKVQEFEDDKPYIELCWEAEQDARFLLGISNDRTSFSMRAEPVTPASQRVRPPTGSPLRKSYTQNREIKTESIYSQFKNNQVTSALDNRASFLPYRPTKKELSNKPSRTEKRLSTAILSKNPTGRNKTPASRSKSDSETYRYSQDYNTGTLTRDDDIDHLEDLRLSLLSWTTTTHESFVGSAGMQNENVGSPSKAVQRSVSDLNVKRDWRENSKRTPERRGERKSPSVAYSGRSSRFEDTDAMDEEVARITAGASHASSISFNGSQRSRSAQDLRDTLFADSPTDPFYEAQSLAYKRRMEYDGKTFFAGARRMPMRKYNFMT
ncbi:uncharacterized protein LOC114536142 isoform X2 [Dendronephthya gigantea]|uniref:uncharacterized protein LOC114536142 isoform X2 n=1 Tax=Dendronephthya gigantea TaxID=151771 RepID=UPI00106B19CB|nr:uncharacterized protein LOC114536142 isoform X2 [Dendronephthya gigantea]